MDAASVLGQLAPTPCLASAGIWVWDDRKQWPWTVWPNEVHSRRSAWGLVAASAANACRAPTHRNNLSPNSVGCKSQRDARSLRAVTGSKQKGRHRTPQTEKQKRPWDTPHYGRVGENYKRQGELTCRGCVRRVHVARRRA